MAVLNATQEEAADGTEIAGRPGPRRRGREAGRPAARRLRRRREDRRRLGLRRDHGHVRARQRGGRRRARRRRSPTSSASRRCADDRRDPRPRRRRAAGARRSAGTTPTSAPSGRAVEVGEIFDTVGGFIALGARCSGCCCCCRSTSRSAATSAAARLDGARARVRRPRTWPRASERLDRAETELEELTGATAVAEPEPGGTPAGGIPAATRVTHERPALERITMERAALAPHPRWRRFVDRATQPRVLVAIGVVALLLGAGGDLRLPGSCSPTTRARAASGSGGSTPATSTVAVLNGTSINGLAGKVASDIEAAGYEVGAITNTDARASRRPRSSTRTARSRRRRRSPATSG